MILWLRTMSGFEGNFRLITRTKKRKRRSPSTIRIVKFGIVPLALKTRKRRALTVLPVKANLSLLSVKANPKGSTRRSMCKDKALIISLQMQTSSARFKEVSSTVKKPTPKRNLKEYNPRNKSQVSTR